LFIRGRCSGALDADPAFLSESPRSNILRDRNLEFDINNNTAAGLAKRAIWRKHMTIGTGKLGSAIAVLAVGLAIAVGVFHPRVLRGQAAGSKTIHVQEHAINVTYVPVQKLLGSTSSANQGDYVSWDDPLFDPGTGAQVGHVMGLCTVVDPTAQVYACPGVTFILTGRGEIAVQGDFDATGKPTVTSVLGGTGEFLGITGSVRGQALSPTLNDFVFTLTRDK